MNQTRVDDLLIEMITPKVKEIEQKFSRGDGLTQEDINTLLLKAQYNHINHLDSRLNDVVASVQSLEVKFLGVEGKFQGLEGKFQGLEGKFQVLEGKFQVLEGKFQALENKLSSFEAVISQKLDGFAANQDLKIERAINTNMRWSIGMIAVIVTLLKLADMFV
jgi:chromosome segregation ATPase